MAVESGMQTKQAPAAAPPVAAKQETSLALMKRTVVDVVAAKVEGFVKNHEIDLPASYSVGNALKAAWLVLQETEDRNHAKALDVCTKDSIANAMLDMVVQGLNPIKNQVYFIVYGKQLTAQRSYFGSMAVAKMVNPDIDEFSYSVVYEKDQFKYGIKNGKKSVIEHGQELGNVDKKNIIGAYAISLDKAGEPLRAEIMTIEEIKQAWKQSKMNPITDKGDVKVDSAHGKFTADMAMKTVVNKLCKAIVNASSDRALLLERMNRAEDLSDRAAAEAEIEEQANTGEVIDISVTETVQNGEVKNDDIGLESTDPATTMSRSCPNTGDNYMESYCKGCPTRNGCPAWPEDKKSEKKGPGF